MSGYLPSLPRAVEGQPVTPDHVNKPNEFLASLEIRGGSGPGAVGVSRSPAGTTIYPPPPQRVDFARITSKGGSASVPVYGWQQLIPTAGGQWENGPMSGPADATPGMLGAFEVNNNSNVPTGTTGNASTGGGAIVVLHLCESCNCFNFQFGACPTS